MLVYILKYNSREQSPINAAEFVLLNKSRVRCAFVAFSRFRRAQLLYGRAAQPPRRFNRHARGKVYHGLRYSSAIDDADISRFRRRRGRSASAGPAIARWRYQAAIDIPSPRFRDIQYAFHRLTSKPLFLSRGLSLVVSLFARGDRRHRRRRRRRLLARSHVDKRSIE